MSTNLRNFTKSVYGFDHVLKLTGDNDLDSPSPCDGWTGSDVIKHAMGVVMAVQSAATTGEMPKEWPELGGDIIAQWETLRDETLAALDQPGVIHADVNGFFGPTTVDGFLPMMTCDLTIHTWDLARTAGADDRLDPGLVAVADKVLHSFPPDMMRSSQTFAEAVKVDDDASAQDRMLAFAGRRP